MSRITRVSEGDRITVEVSGGVARSFAPEDGVLVHITDDKESGGRARVPLFISTRELREVIDE